MDDRKCVTGLLALGLLVLMSNGSVAVAEDDGPVVRVNVTAEEFLTQAKEFAPQGYQPVGISGYAVDGETNYAIIWDKKPFAAWAERHDLRAEEFQDNFDAYLGRGLRPFSLSAHTVEGNVRFSGLWEQRAGEVRFNSVGQSAEQFEKTSDVHEKQGFQVKQVVGYTIDGEPRFSALWEKDTDAEPSETRLDLTAENFPQTSKGLANRGYRPASLKGYEVEGAARFTGVWEKRSGVEFDAEPALTEKDLERTGRQLTRLGYTPISISGYTVAGKTRFAAIWEKAERAGQ